MVLFNCFVHIAVTLMVFGIALRRGFAMPAALLAGVLFAVHPGKAEMLLGMPLVLPASPTVWLWAMAVGIKQWVFPVDMLLVHPLPQALASFAHLSHADAVVINAGRLMYVPSIFLSLAAAALIARLYRFLAGQEAIIRYLFVAAVFILLTGLMTLSYAQVSLGLDPLRLWQYQARLFPHPIVLDNLAAATRALPEYQKALDYANNNVTPDKDTLERINTVEKIYLKAVSMDPGYGQAYYDLAGFYAQLGRWQDAVAWYGKTLAVDPRRQEAYFALGRAYQRMDKPQEAVTVFNRLLAVFPDDEKAMARVIDAYNVASDDPQSSVYREKREEVLAAYEQWARRKKYGAVDFFNLGFLYEQVGGREEAVRFYRKALELKGDYDKPLYRLAGLYKQAGDLKTALALYERLVRSHPKFANGYLNIGIIYNALGDTDRARYLYQKTVDLDPANADGYFNLGYLSEAKGELKEAIAFYEKTVEADPKYAEAYYNMGNVYATLTQYAEAMAAYLKTVAINPDHQNAYVNLSILSFKSRDFRGAMRYLEEARLLGYNPPESYLKSLEPYKNKK
jgi:tetratricopeptide (TPR) repeat protein